MSLRHPFLPFTGRTTIVTIVTASFHLVQLTLGPTFRLFSSFDASHSIHSNNQATPLRFFLLLRSIIKRNTLRSLVSRPKVHLFFSVNRTQSRRLWRRIILPLHTKRNGSATASPEILILSMPTIFSRTNSTKNYSAPDERVKRRKG